MRIHNVIHKMQQRVSKSQENIKESVMTGMRNNIARAKELLKNCKCGVTLFLENAALLTYQPQQQLTAARPDDRVIGIHRQHKHSYESRQVVRLGSSRLSCSTMINL